MLLEPSRPFSARWNPLPYGAPFERLLHRVQDYPGPVIAMIEGGVWGGAFDLASRATFRSAADSFLRCNSCRDRDSLQCVKHDPFHQCPGLNKAKETVYTAEPISGSDALKAGILNHPVPAADLERFTPDFSDKILKNAPLAVRALKEQFRLLSKGHPVDAETAEEIQSIRSRVCDSKDYGEGIRAFQEKRSLRFQRK